MPQTLNQIAQTLRAANKKVQLIYAFNGTGKTQLSRGFKKMVESDNNGADEVIVADKIKIMYYNAFTEDLFYWNNLEGENKLKIQSNEFIDWIVRDRGQDQNIIKHFQRYTDDKLNPFFVEQQRTVNDEGRSRNVSYYPEVAFSFLRGTERYDNVKVSKAEERCFIWSVFYSLAEEVVGILNAPLENREEDTFNDLEYLFIDDPVSSLDDNHLIELAVDIANLFKSSKSNLKFIITTHNPLFYNVISNELNNNVQNPLYVIGGQNTGVKKWVYHSDNSIKYRFVKNEDGSFNLDVLGNKTPFSYHLQLLREIQKVKANPLLIKKYHFNFIRNILEKTATFLGYSNWEKLLPIVNGNPDPFANRILNLSSHSAHAGEEIGEVQENDRIKLIELVSYLESNYKFSELVEQNVTV